MFITISYKFLIIMIEFSIEKKIDCDPRKVWDIVKDLSSFTKYWHGTRELNLREVEKNVYEGELRFAFPAKGRVKISILENDRKVIINYLKGPFIGTMSITVYDDKIVSTWRVEMKGIYKLFEKWNEKHFKEGTIHALERIEQTLQIREY
ncbi:SRPBCC family protein [Sulfolobus sp. B1]|nr:SRPBCC family protein [Sulfolobus sp. A20-N-F8]TRM79211.1 SRPBCC family protein [Sulfolobus sp. B5]TRM81039.1 SRPBCC family protein [Sulfolobus sp. D5]TRM88625.1 SRPBCC family protein [Sulfolobus sp. C3]TRM97019.1 SRPBCC family protein [Sulfolobus sp. B1]TRN02981.1 SRPBCC family protein [Sulfolobus sp. F1]TRN04253.1 SRPBCC family protein [Sulfolobus sp. E1]